MTGQAEAQVQAEVFDLASNAPSGLNDANFFPDIDPQGDEDQHEQREDTCERECVDENLFEGKDEDEWHESILDDLLVGTELPLCEFLKENQHEHDLKANLHEHDLQVNHDEQEHTCKENQHELDLKVNHDEHEHTCKENQHEPDLKVNHDEHKHDCKVNQHEHQHDCKENQHEHEHDLKENQHEHLNKCGKLQGLPEVLADIQELLGMGPDCFLGRWGLPRG